jgi:amidohydrolase
MHCSATVTFSEGTIPVTNDADVSAQVRRVIRPLLNGEEAFVMNERSTVAEDMAYLMDDIPGMFLLVGSANDARELNYGHHHPRFDFDEDALPLAAAILARAAASYVMDDVI